MLKEEGNHLFIQIIIIYFTLTCYFVFKKKINIKWTKIKDDIDGIDAGV